MYKHLIEIPVRDDLGCLYEVVRAVEIPLADGTVEYRVTRQHVDGPIRLGVDRYSAAVDAVAQAIEIAGWGEAGLRAAVNLGLEAGAGE